METALLATPALVKPIQDDAKTETRRTRGLEWVNREPDNWALRDIVDGVARFESLSGTSHEIRCPYGTKGDRLWIRENWYTIKEWNHIKPSELPKNVFYKVGYMADGDKADWGGKGRPSIHMPRWLSRITLEILSISVERLWNIKEIDATREGVPCGKFVDGPNGKFSLIVGRGPGTYHWDGFKFIWMSLNGRDSWDMNPWVWVIKFKRCLT